jgi:hypothetical protein
MGNSIEISFMMAHRTVGNWKTFVHGSQTTGTAQNVSVVERKELNLKDDRGAPLQRS